MSIFEVESSSTRFVKLVKSRFVFFGALTIDDVVCEKGIRRQLTI